MAPRTEHAPDLIAHGPPPATGSDRAFGLVFAALFAIVGVMPWPTGGYVRGWALAVSGALLAAALLFPRLLAPLNRLWGKVGLLLNRIVSPLALAIVFVLAVLPTALILRLLGKAPLRLRAEPGARSYWIERAPPGRSDAQMKKQF